MLSISYKNHFFTFNELVGKSDLLRFDQTKADVILKFELSHSKPESPVIKGTKHKHSFELNIPNFIIDLRQDEVDIYKKISKSTRADIRKANEMDNFSYFEIENPTDDQLKKFSLLFNPFAHKKKIPPCNLEKLTAIREHNALLMTYVTDEKNNILCAGMVLVDRENSQYYGLYGVSVRLSKETNTERRRIGRAYKFLSWKEILSAKKRGMDWYNFGGEVTEADSQGVNDFKKKFGAITGYDRRIYIANSFIGRICVFLLFNKWKRNFSMYQTNNGIYKTT